MDNFYKNSKRVYNSSHPQKLIPWSESMRKHGFIGVVVVFFILAVASVSLFAQSPIRGLVIAARPIAGDTVTVGRQIAVFIAVDRYREWLPLKKPVSDSRSLKEILTRRYYIDEVRELYNEDATRVGILKLFESLIEDARPEDSIFLYYAGHGHLDRLSDTGSWIPQDAGTDPYEQRNWLSNSQLRGMISKMKSRHVVLVSDSCFSGDILNVNRASAPTIDNEYFKKAFARRSRQVLSSGASETVADDSVFSRALIRTLEENTASYLDPYILFSEVRLSVTKSTPLLGNLKDTEYQEGGSFIFFLKDSAATKTPTPVVLKPVQAMGSLMVDAPSEVVVSLRSAGFTTETRGGTVTQELPAGIYEVAAKAPGFLDAMTTLEVSASQTALWRPYAVGRLTLNLDPPDSVCSIDKPKPVILKSTTADLPPGDYRLTVMKDGYHDLPLNVSLTAGRIVPVTATLEKLTPGRVILPAFPVDLNCSLKGQPADLRRIPAGVELQIEFTSPQAVSLAVVPMRLLLGEGETRKLEIPVGRFTLPYLMEGTVLTIGGKELPISTSPLDLGRYASPELPVGEYEIALSGKLAYGTKVTIAPGGKTELPGYRDAVLGMLAQLRGSLAKQAKSIPAKKSAGTASLIAGILGAAGSAATWFLGQQAMDSYTSAIDPDAIAKARDQISLYGTLLPASAAIGGIGLILAPILWSGPSFASLEDSIRALDESILRIKKF